MPCAVVQQCLAEGSPHCEAVIHPLRTLSFTTRRGETPTCTACLGLRSRPPIQEGEKAQKGSQMSERQGLLSRIQISSSLTSA